MRAAAINLRALPEQRDLIDQAADLLGKTRSDFMLEAACERARAVMLDQVFFSLDAEKFRQFTALLENRPPPSTVHSRWAITTTTNQRVCPSVSNPSTSPICERMDFYAGQHFGTCADFIDTRDAKNVAKLGLCTKLAHILLVIL